MKKRWLLMAAALLLVLGTVAGWAAGPWWAMRGIDQALTTRSPAALEKHIDFPALRVNLKAQLEDRIVRAAGPDQQANRFGALATFAASKLAGAGVDTVVTPAGLVTLLHGQGLVRRATGHTETADSYAPPASPKPFRDVQWRYESLQRFTATARNEQQQETVFVFARQGLRWKLVDIRLPPGWQAAGILG